MKVLRHQTFLKVYDSSSFINHLFAEEEILSTNGPYEGSYAIFQVLHKLLFSSFNFIHWISE